MHEMDWGLVQRAMTDKADRFNILQALHEIIRQLDERYGYMLKRGRGRRANRWTRRRISDA